MSKSVRYKRAKAGWRLDIGRRRKFAIAGRQMAYGKQIAAARGRFLRGRRAGYQRTSGFYGRFGAGGELKFHDIDVDDASIAVNGTILNTGSVNLIAQGVTESTRVGRKCCIKKINWRFSLEKVSTTVLTSGDEIIRVMLYLDKQCNGATATVAGILASDDYQSFNNLANTARFTILMDRTYAMNNPTNTVLAGPIYAYGTMNIQDSFFKTVDIPLEFGGVAGIITEIRSNNIGVLVLSKTGSLVNFDSKMRLRFSDNG